MNRSEFDFLSVLVRKVFPGILCFGLLMMTGCFGQKATVSGNGNEKTAATSSEGVKGAQDKQLQASTTPTGMALAANEKSKGEATGLFANREVKRVKAKGLYLTATSAGARLNFYLDLAKKTEVNSYVIDYKEDEGTVCVNSKVPLAKEIKAIDVRYDPVKVVKKLHENNVYAIARIVCFKDPILAEKKPEYAIKNKDGSLFKHNGMYWVNAYNKAAWQYNIDLAKEAFESGFDEVQFGYIRFPDGKKAGLEFGDTRGLKLYENINEFLHFARTELPNRIIAGDVFAIICESPADTENIGQYFEKIGEDIDYICPMAYPSHYNPGQIIHKVMFPKPDLDPHGVIYQTLLHAKERLAAVPGHKPIVRTYLQSFSASWLPSGNWQKYGAKQIREQVQAVYDAGYEEWFLWDPLNRYKEEFFEKKS